jgi:ubiquinone/menaquinone biosynthesis C-methylase UbiE
MPAWAIEGAMNMDKIKNHFEGEAQEFDRIILTIMPNYATMVRALVEAIPFGRSVPLRVIDLGCGIGTVAAQVLDVFPNAQVTCLDLAENMIAIVQARQVRRDCLIAGAAPSRNGQGQAKLLSSDLRESQFRRGLLQCRCCFSFK